MGFSLHFHGNVSGSVSYLTIDNTIARVYRNSEQYHRVPSVYFLLSYYIALKLILSLILIFFHHISSTDEDSLLDVSAEIIEETPVKIKLHLPRSNAEDVIGRLSIITPESGRADAANPSFSNTKLFLLNYGIIKFTYQKLHNNQ